MALTDFFRINLPYGIAKNENGQWSAFNREYKPLGFNESTDTQFNINSNIQLPIYTKYNGMTEDFLLKLGWNGEDSVRRNEKGEIVTVFLYNDGSNPRNQSKDNPALWTTYFDKLKALSKKERKM